MRLLSCLLGLLAASAVVEAGPYVEEIPRTELAGYSILCVAGDYAGTSEGLFRRSGENWLPVDGFSGRPVELCLRHGDSLLATFGGALYDVASGKKILALPAGTPRALAARENLLLYGSGRALFGCTLPAARLSPVPLPAGVTEVRAAALGPAGEIALASAEGLFLRKGAQWRAVYPANGGRSWAPVDTRAVAYDAGGRLWFACPQGLGHRDANGWRLLTGEDGLPYDDFTAIAPGETGVMWFGTRLGAIRYDGATWEYRQGRRWLPSDEVHAITVDSRGDARIATPAGLGVIERRPATLSGKARFFEEEIDRRHRRTPYEYILSVSLPVAGDKSRWEQHDSDNDGLWTAMYGAGECFSYGATQDPDAKRRARKAFEALRFLSLVTQGGSHPAPPGFPARSILPTSGPDPNARDSAARDERRRAHSDRLWKVMSPRWPKSADGKWYWKTDTSSDELDGHYFFYGLYYDLVAETPGEKKDVQEVVRAITDHLLAHNYSLVDWDGQPTRWAIFDPASLNSGKMFLTERGLNSLSMLAYLKVAAHVTADRRYDDAYRTLVTKHHYATNAMVAKLSAGPGTGNQSDDEMAFMCYFHLVKYEADKDLAQWYAKSLATYWSVEQPEMNPFFNFVAASSLKGQRFESAFRTEDLTPRGAWLEDSLDTLRRLPKNRIDWGHRNARRKDIIPLRSFLAEDDEIAGVGYRRNGKVLPADERYFAYWNHNPFRLNSGGRGHQLGDGAVFLLPYYMGLYYRFIEE